MAARNNDYMALFHYVDDAGFGGDIEVHADNVDELFARIASVQQHAKNRNWTGRPADKEREYKNTYVKVEPKKGEARPEPMEQAAADSGFAAKACPVCDTAMEGVYTKRDGSALPFGPFWACPNCQKKVNMKQGKKEIPF